MCRVEDRYARRLEDKVCARTNAALMLAQLGDSDTARQELEASMKDGDIVKMDTCAALAALYYAAGSLELANETWATGCSNSAVVCGKYRDREWLERSQHWPPVMLEYVTGFLANQRSGPSTTSALA